MTLPQKTPNWLIAIILIIGVLAISTASILIRLANISADSSGLGFSLVLAASRLTLSAIIILPAWPKLLRQNLQPEAWLYASGAGLCLALHFALWITSLSYTSIAASTALVTTNPVWVALLSWFWFGEKLSKVSAVGIAIALLGGMTIALVSAGDTNVGSNPILGDFLALAGSWTVSMYLLLGREAQQRGLGIGGYIAIAYTVAAIVLLPLPLVFNTSYTGYPHIVYFYILLTAIVPQLIGHTIFNWVVAQISPTLVTLAILFEPVGASGLGYLILGEVPAPTVLAGAAVLLLGVATATFGTQKSH
jgi:drug/metabolite transporter (DMT)-like permease